METDVVIVGAGAAGLAAARRLAEQSLRVVILEARDRIGGRVLSQPAELGAEFVHGPAPRTKALLHEAGVATIPTSDDSWVFLDGRLQADTREFRAPHILDRAFELPEDVSVDTVLRPLESDAATREDAQAARMFVEGFDAADPLVASARGIAEEWNSGVDAISVRPATTYAPMFKLLHDACVDRGVDVCFSTVVEQIEHDRDVRVYSVANGDAHEVHAKVAVVTVPAGILREFAIEFMPALPREKVRALEHIVMGTVVKVAMRFKKPFWHEPENGRYRAPAFFRNPDGAFTAFWQSPDASDSMVMAWAGGPKATALRYQLRDRVLDLAVSEFANLFGTGELGRKALDVAMMHDWNNDNFSRGAYSYLTVGAGDARAALARPVGDLLFFAGEATATNGEGGTVNGALESGERVAEEVLARWKR